jgi:hypothetical protein
MFLKVRLGVPIQLIAATQALKRSGNFGERQLSQCQT